MTEQAWLAVIKDWEPSGLAQKVFCRERRISYSQFCVWRSKLIERGLIKRQQAVKPTRAKPAFIPVSLESSQVVNQRGSIEVQLPHGIVLRIPC